MAAGRRYELYAWMLLLVVVFPFLPGARELFGAGAYILPAYWLVFLASAYLFLPRVYTPGRLRQQESAHSCGMMGAAIFLAIKFLIAVFLKQLAATPYDNSPFGIFYNFLTIFPALGAREITRAYCIGVIWRKGKHRKLLLIGLTAALVLTEINYNQIQAISTAEDLFIYVSEEWGTVIAKHILQTVLAFYGGAVPAAAYEGIIEGFQRVFPFLPNLPWIGNSAIGIVFPVIYCFAVQDSCQGAEGERMEKEEGGTASYLVSLFLAVAFSWFCVGVFPVYPSVVLTGSMEPGIDPGDIVLISKMQEEQDIYDLKEGDVINFNREDITITHRIIQVVSDEAGNVTFQTKGDNNQSPDEILVNPNDINGIVVQVVPKVGLPVLIMKSGNPVPEGVVDHVQKTEQT